MICNFLATYIDDLNNQGFNILLGQGEDEISKYFLYPIHKTLYQSPTFKISDSYLIQGGTYFSCDIDVELKLVISFSRIDDSKINSDDILALKEKYAKNNIEKIKNHKSKLMTTSKKDNRVNYEVPEDIFIDQLTWDLIISSIKLDVYLLIYGPTGCGKTASIYAASKLLGYDFYPINCGTLLKPEQALIGSVQAKEGSTFIVESEFLKHYTSEKPTLIFLNELNRTPQTATNYMMTILDKLQSYIYVKELGKRIYKGANVKFIADSNIGKKYTDTRNLDAAFLNRFLKTEISYLPENKEIELIKTRVPEADINDITQLVKKANLIRDQEEQLMVSISTRELIEISKFFTLGFSLSEVVEKIVKTIFLNTHSSNKETISKIFDSIS